MGGAVRQLLLCVGLAAFVTLPAPTLSSQGRRYMPTHAGTFVDLPAARISVDRSFNAADQTEVRRVGGQLVSVMRAVPLLGQPHGFDVLPRVFVEQADVDGNGDSKRPRVARYFVGLDLANYVDGGKGPVVDTRSAAAQVTVTVNDYPSVFTDILSGNGVHGDPRNNEDEEGQFLSDVPEPSATRHGFSVYGDWVVMMRKPAPIFLPVTRERYLKVVIARVDRTMTRAAANTIENPTNNPGLAAALAERDRALQEIRAGLDEMKQRLASMSAKERALPAYVDSTEAIDRMPKFSDGPGDAHPIVCYNPALFDAAVAKTAPQMIAVKISPGEGELTDIVSQLDAAIDWKGLAALLK
jgi:hypothetical protein